MYQDQQHPVGAPPPQGNSQYCFDFFCPSCFLEMTLCLFYRVSSKGRISTTGISSGWLSSTTAGIRSGISCTRVSSSAISSRSPASVSLSGSSATTVWSGSAKEEERQGFRIS
ncbi:unnamed protein product [Brassica rapa subsp. trilocularis]